MATVWVPSLLRALTQKKSEVIVAGATVREIVDGMDALFPGFKARLVEGDKLRPGMMVVVDGKYTNQGLKQVLGENSEVQFVPAIAGG